MKHVNITKLDDDQRAQAIRFARNRRGDIVELDDADFYRLQPLQQPRRGIAAWRPGDTVAALTKAVGIKPCGKCKERQKAMNEKYEKFIDRIQGK